MEEEEALQEKSMSTLKDKREQKIKEQFLDEAFKKAEIKRGLRLSDDKKQKKSYEKTFPKLGFLLILLSIFGLVFINNAPWAFIKYNTDYGSVDAYIYRDFNDRNNEYQEIIKLFETPYYMGLSISDFTNIPASVFNGFILLIILGLLITILGIIDKKLNFSMKTFTLIHFILASVAIIPCIFIVLPVMSFLSAHLLIFYNMSQINGLIPNITVTFLTFPAAFILVALGFIIIKIVFTVMKVDINELQKLSQIGKPALKKPFSKYVFGGQPQ